jgi:light-regulated signal transduction histidine kinase (bacteriophytochrome)
MSRISLHLGHRENERLLAEWLGERYAVVRRGSEFDGADLHILDGVGLDQVAERLRRRRAEASPVILPALLVTQRQDVRLLTRQVWTAVDDLIISPIEKGELLARVEILLRMRRYSVDLDRARTESYALAQAMAHDLRAPLRLLDMKAALMGAQIEAGDATALRESAAAIRRGVRSMGDFIEDLLAYARLGHTPAHVARLDVDALVRDAVESLVAGSSGPRAEIVVEPLPPASADPTMLRQVFANLLSNAVKFSAGAERPHVVVRGQEEGETVAYTVEDNGVGFDMAYAPRLFGLFQRVHASDDYPGNGIGLALVKVIVERHGGRVWAESAPGEGARFGFTLPRQPAG